MIKFLTNSLLTTIQDLGRNGYRAFGVNPNGAMDKISLRLINILLGNDENEAGLEIHFPAPKILFESDTVIAIGGANFSAKIDDEPVENWQTVQINTGQILSFTNKTKGNRLYLSVAGGFEITDWLDSKSTNLKAECGGFEGRKLGKDDRIKFKTEKQKSKVKSQRISPFFISKIFDRATIRLIEGSEFGVLTPLSSENFLKNRYQITQDSDRMGFRLKGEPLYLLHDKELVSSAVTFGTIQLLPNGQTIILMADHQTTGGYPRIGNIIVQDLSVLAQLSVNDKIQFETVSLETAENLTLEFENEVSFLKVACNLQPKNE